MDTLWALLFLAVIGVVAFKFFNAGEMLKKLIKKPETSPPPEEDDDYPYQKRQLLTGHEYDFYQELRPLVESYELHIIVKTRLADLVEVKNSDDTEKWNEYFSKIRSKHIDFVITEPDEMTAECLIELQDSSHDEPERIERDRFVRELCEKTGLPLIMTYGELDEIEKYLDENWVRKDD